MDPVLDLYNHLKGCVSQIAIENKYTVNYNIRKPFKSSDEYTGMPDNVVIAKMFLRFGADIESAIEKAIDTRHFEKFIGYKQQLLNDHWLKLTTKVYNCLGPRYIISDKFHVIEMMAMSELASNPEFYRQVCSVDRLNAHHMAVIAPPRGSMGHFAIRLELGENPLYILLILEFLCAYDLSCRHIGDIDPEWFCQDFDHHLVDNACARIVRLSGMLDVERSSATNSSNNTWSKLVQTAPVPEKKVDQKPVQEPFKKKVSQGELKKLRKQGGKA